VDAITLLKNDHKTVEKLFKRFEKLEKDDGPDEEKRSVVDEIIEELSVHAAIEEQVFYPAIREAVPDAEDTVLESLEEHHVAKWVLSELADMDPSHERFDAKVTVLMENVRHHVEEEEQELFPEVRKELGRKRLGEVGDALEKAKIAAPRSPEPRMPDEPPGNIVSETTAEALQQAERAVRAPKKAPGKKAAKRGS
jgi:hemerythrin superfamily protein